MQGPILSFLGQESVHSVLMLWDSDYALLFVIWASAVVSEPEQGAEPGLCCIRLKELEKQLPSQSDSKSWGFPPDLTHSKAAKAALCTTSSFSRQKIFRRSGVFVFPPFIMFSDQGGSPELSQLHVLTISFPPDFLHSAGISAHLNLLDFSLSWFFLPDFSQKFSTHCYLRLPSLPRCWGFFLELQVVCMVVSPVVFLSGILQ